MALAQGAAEVATEPLTGWDIAPNRINPKGAHIPLATAAAGGGTPGTMSEGPGGVSEEPRSHAQLPGLPGAATPAGPKRVMTRNGNDASQSLATSA